jgi:hypothetical protein
LREETKTSLLFAGINIFIQAGYKLINSNVKSFANPQQGSHRDRSARLDLLPMTSRKTKRDHILLAVAALFPECPGATSQISEELCFVLHVKALRRHEQKDHEQISVDYGTIVSA